MNISSVDQNRGVLVASRSHFSDKLTAMYQLRPWLFRVKVLVGAGGHFSGIAVVFYALEGLSFSCVPRSVLRVPFPKILADKMERWCCTNQKCECYIKWNESREIFGGNVMHNHDTDNEAFFKRQILNNSAERKALEDFSERLRRLIHKELQSQCMDTLTYRVHKEH
jgi:hypothetical protein